MIFLLFTEASTEAYRIFLFLRLAQFLRSESICVLKNVEIGCKKKLGSRLLSDKRLYPCKNFPRLSKLM